ncbi:MAG: hypothetical protein CMJ58_11440 [Planctomycetaceae bacterium]|nr:hypothetical protein [Planctomycetaceae bacterium]
MIAALLLVSAVLKTYDPTDTATLASAYRIPIWLTAAVIQGEIFVAILLLSGLWQSAVLRAVAVMFVAFAVFSSYRAWLGAESCGCFGPVQVNPAFTAALDVVVAVVAAMASSPSLPGSISPRQAKGLAGTYAVVGIVAAVLFVVRSPVTETSLLLENQGGLVILEPETWVGKEFPLASFVEPPVDTLSGSWVILLFHHDCPDCQAAIPKYDALASSSGEAKHILLIEVPPYGSQPPPVRAAIVARLSDANEWFVQAPVELTVDDGKVTGASLDLCAVYRSTGSSHD